MLDIDLDFFVNGTASMRAHDDPRLDEDEYPPWDIEDAVAFLRDRCLLSGHLPGLVVERHGELFERWRSAVDSGALSSPFSVTHVDAHADLGMGDSGYVHVVTDLMSRPAGDRRFPRTGEGGLDDGNYLAFALACRWIDELTYVYNGRGPGRPADLMKVYMKDLDLDSGTIQIPNLCKRDLDRVWWPDDDPDLPESDEPEVSLSCQTASAFQAVEPFDVVCLARSAAFTPARPDELFDVIRERFIDESAFPT